LNSAVLATIWLLALLGLWRSVMGRYGALGFWQVAGRMPDEAFDWFISDDAWVVVDPRRPHAQSDHSRDGFVGPFKLVVPKVGGVVTLYADADRIDESQAAFLAAHGSSRDSDMRSWPSFLAFAYPLVATITYPQGSGLVLEALGYGLANLGYLLALAAIIPGHFRALYLNYRIPTGAAAIGAWLLGIVLVNVSW